MPSSTNLITSFLALEDRSYDEHFCLSVSSSWSAKLSNLATEDRWSVGSILTLLSHYWVALTLFRSKARTKMTFGSHFAEKQKRLQGTRECPASYLESKRSAALCYFWCGQSVGYHDETNGSKRRILATRANREVQTSNSLLRQLVCYRRIVFGSATRFGFFVIIHATIRR